MSTEHLNKEHDTQPIDEKRESELLSFADSMNSSVKSESVATKHEPKWLQTIKLRFRRRTLTLIATSVLTVLAAVATLLVMLFLKDNGTIVTPSDDPISTEQTQADNTITLLDKTEKKDSDEDPSNDVKGAQLKQIAISNADDSYTIALDEETTAYAIQGYEDIDLSNQMVVTLRHYTESIQAMQVVEDTTDLTAYGLDKPQASASITYTDGTSARLVFGNKTPSESGYYGQLEGDNNVYIFSSDAASLFRFRSNAFVNTTLITAPSIKTGDESGTALLKDITFSGTAFPTPLMMRRSNHNDGEELSYFSYIITAPYLRCTTDQVSSALSGFTYLSAEQALYLHPTEAQKTKMGFDNPLIKISATMAVETDVESDSDTEVNIKNYYNSVEYNLIIGSTDENGNYIAMLEGVDAIFLISKSKYEYVLGRTYENSVNQYLFFKHITSLGRISVEQNGKQHDFYLTHYPEKENADDQLVVTIDGKVYSTSEFRELYELIMALERQGVPTEEPSGDISLTLSLYDTNGELYLSASYYETTATLCAVKTSQGEWITTLWSDISFFAKQVENYLNGENVILKN